jgi:hypothetical protein
METWRATGVAQRNALLNDLVYAYETNRQLLHKRVAKAERRAAVAEAELAELQRSVFGVRTRPRLPQPPPQQRAPLETITNAAVLQPAPSTSPPVSKRRPQASTPTQFGPAGGTELLPELAQPPWTPRADPLASPVSLLNPRLLLKVFGYLQPYVLTSQVARVYFH